MTGPVTIGDLSRSGQLLEIGCLDCSRVVYVEARTLRIADSQAGPFACPPPEMLAVRRQERADSSSDMGKAGCQSGRDENGMRRS